MSARSDLVVSVPSKCERLCSTADRPGATRDDILIDPDDETVARSAAAAQSFRPERRGRRR